MTRRRDMMLEDLILCEHTPETPVSENGEIVYWLCRCGRRVKPKAEVPPPSDKDEPDGMGG